MRLVVVGGDAAGMSAATSVRATLPDADIVVVERGSHTSYSACGIPYYIGGQLDRAADLVVKQPEAFRRMGIDVRTGAEAVAIDAAAKTVSVRDVGSGEQRDERYDRLLWAAGAHPQVPSLPGIEEYGHFVQTLDEGEHLRAHLESLPEVRHVVVVGAGYIGMEIAESLVRHGVAATLIDRNEQVMKTLDADMACHVQAALEGFGVKVALGESLLAVHGDHGGCREVVTDAATHSAQALIWAMGSKPNVELPRAAGCALGATGALVVDEGMRTTVGGIWAAGDCVETTHLVSGARVNVQLGTHANKQGKVAGLTLCDLPAAFPGVVGTAATKVCEWEIARTGLSEREAAALGLDYQVASFSGSARAGYMPDPGKVFVKMLAEAGSGRLLGAQLVGTGNVAKRIDVAATWCQLGVAVQDAQLFDLSYAPPFGGVWDLLQVGARKLTKSLGLSPSL